MAGYLFVVKIKSLCCENPKDMAADSAMDMDADWRLFAAFASIPVVASLIGYGTNILAIQMTFLPLDYIGCYEEAFRRCGFSLGWQGIIPANAAKIAEKAVSIITTRLVTIDEVFARLDARKIAALTRQPIRKALADVIPKVAAVYAPDIWESMPLVAREELILSSLQPLHRCYFSFIQISQYGF